MIRDISSYYFFTTISSGVFIFTPIFYNPNIEEI